MELLQSDRGQHCGSLASHVPNLDLHHECDPYLHCLSLYSSAPSGVYSFLLRAVITCPAPSRITTPTLACFLLENMTLSTFTLQHLDCGGTHFMTWCHSLMAIDHSFAIQNSSSKLSELFVTVYLLRRLPLCLTSFLSFHIPQHIMTVCSKIFGRDSSHFCKCHIRSMQSHEG